MNIKPTLKHFDVFKKECEYWIKYYGLSEWDIEYAMYDSDFYDGGFNALCAYDIQDRNATLILCRDCFEVIGNSNADTINALKQNAHHEVAELLLSEIHSCAIMPYGVSEFHADAVRHAVIAKLQNSIFNDKKRNTSKHINKAKVKSANTAKPESKNIKPKNTSAKK